MERLRIIAPGIFEHLVFVDARFAGLVAIVTGPAAPVAPLTDGLLQDERNPVGASEYPERHDDPPSPLSRPPHPTTILTSVETLRERS